MALTVEEVYESLTREQRASISLYIDAKVRELFASELKRQELAFELMKNGVEYPIAIKAVKALFATDWGVK